MKSIAPRILKMNAMAKLMEETEQLEDSHEKESREQLLRDIWSKITEYDAHILDYEYKQHSMKLSERVVEFVPVKRCHVVAQWDELFTSLVSEESKKDVGQYNDQYKWHIFSFGLLDALKADDARNAFNTIQKDTVYLFYQRAKESFLVKDASFLKAIDFDFDSTMDKADVYLFDITQKWTYVKTHESSCGPYFYCIK